MRLARERRVARGNEHDGAEDPEGNHGEETSCQFPSAKLREGPADTQHTGSEGVGGGHVSISHCPLASQCAVLDAAREIIADLRAHRSVLGNILEPIRGTGELRLHFGERRILEGLLVEIDTLLTTLDGMTA